MRRSRPVRRPRGRSIVTSPAARAEDESVELVDVLDPLDSKFVGALLVDRVNDRNRVLCILQRQTVTYLRELAQMTNGNYKVVSS
jgi:hypothetical protein